MKLIRALYRGIGFALLLIILALTIIVAGWWPFQVQGVRPGTWFVHIAARVLMKLIAVEIDMAGTEKLAGYSGFIFSNHTSYMDIGVIMAFTPVRFVAKSSIRYWPFIGFFATIIGCVYVDRKNRKSRKETRKVLEKIDTFPPIVLYPEGKTAPVGRLLPFRHGAFEIAQDGRIPYILCPIIYDDPHLVDWKSRSAWLAAWELASRARPLGAKIFVLSSHLPQDDESADDLAQTARQEMLETLVKEGNYEND